MTREEFKTRFKTAWAAGNRCASAALRATSAALLKLADSDYSLAAMIALAALLLWWRLG